MGDPFKLRLKAIGVFLICFVFGLSGICILKRYVIGRGVRLFITPMNVSQSCRMVNGVVVKRLGRDTRIAVGVMV